MQSHRVYVLVCSGPYWRGGKGICEVQGAQQSTCKVLTRSLYRESSYKWVFKKKKKKKMSPLDEAIQTTDMNHYIDTDDANLYETQ